MDLTQEKDWKKKVGFPINYDSGQSSDDDFESRGVVVRHPRPSAGSLLADSGDGAEADLLGTTPPRARIRDKEKRRPIYRSNTDVEACLQRIADDDAMRQSDESSSQPPREVNGKVMKGRLTIDDNTTHVSPLHEASSVPERLKKRASLKLLRAQERDWKQEQRQRESKADSLPSPSPAVPTLVESCSRFMSLSSRLKCRGEDSTAGDDASGNVGGVAEDCAGGAGWRRGGGAPAPPSRVSFHSTFSMLINMGSTDKACRRTRREAAQQENSKISREEQVWQNELKDLIWLGLAARVAGRSLPQQDDYLCAQRAAVPAVVRTILHYRFVNPYKCPSTDESEQDDVENESQTCLSPGCSICAESVGVAMREISSLLDAFYAVIALYPSSSAAEADQPCLAQPRLKNRIRAMCLWYNTALHMRLKMVSLRRMLRSSRASAAHRAASQRTGNKSSENHRASQVRFDLSSTPTDSTSSDASAYSDTSKPVDIRSADTRPAEKNPGPANGLSLEEKQDPADVVDGKEAVKDGSDEQNKCNEEHKNSQEREDVVDSGIDSRSECMGDCTPEIIVSEDGSLHVREAGETGEPGGDDDPLRLGALHELAQLRLLGNTDVPLYRDYHYEMLKTQGVRRCMTFIQKICYNMLRKVYLTLLDPEEAETDPSNEDVSMKSLLNPNSEKTENKPDQIDENSYELRRYGCRCRESVDMRLPSYRSHFVLLSSMCMEAVHDYLALRLEARPAHPSCLTVKQLIHELKEGLDIATEIRCAFVRYAAAALRGEPRAERVRDGLLQLLRTFDQTVAAALQQYLSYLSTMSETESLPRTALAAEWAFTARLAARAPRVSARAPAAFVDIACKQLQRLVQRFDEKFASLMEIEVPNEKEESRYVVYALCRGAQQVYACEREAALQAAQAARALAARLHPRRVRLRKQLCENLMRLCECVVRHTEHIFERSRLPDEPRGEARFEARGDSRGEWARELADSMSARVRELLLQAYKLGFELHRELYALAQAPFRVGGVGGGGGRGRPVSLQEVRPATPALRRRRPDTVVVHRSVDLAMHKELHRFVKESERGSAARFNSRSKFLRSESINEDGVLDCRMFETAALDASKHNELEQLLAEERERYEQDAGDAEEVGEGGQAEECVCEEQRFAGLAARGVVQFARCWMRFVMERCERGRGRRPRWASQGLEFLMLACDPYNTKHLSDEEFEELKQLMDACISHVIGSRPAPLGPPHAPSSATLHTEPSRRVRRALHSPLSNSNGAQSPLYKEGAAPVIPPTECNAPSSQPEEVPGHNGSSAEGWNSETSDYSRRVAEAVRRLDEARDETLRSKRAVGRVLQSAVASYEPKLRQVTFKWQRGLKIGAGTFGKVYTVVNTESGQLLAMKELSVCAGDRRALRRAANELRVLEGVLHPHLVRYYGCELHREEMLLFMELCVEGSLEALLGASGALDEPAVRRYTKQLLSAVQELHSRGIAHRDIKSGNIFLTNEGHCLKLGDFGCAVKIRNNSTVPGELQGFVGTQAYMAPEVFMKSSGHGRGADIWSLGCVVAEMASGKRPFSEYDSNYQIMFVVGMGGRPEIPASLSEEGQEFCRRCLTHDPELRPRAHDLALHHFLMLKSDEDCKCEPAYLIT